MENKTNQTVIRLELLRDQVYKFLRDQILNGEIPPGTPLVEVDIAKKLNVSRTPVREAIQHLKVEGLVYSSKGRRLRVVSSNKSSIEDALEIRKLIEGYASRKAAINANHEQIDQLFLLCNEEKMCLDNFHSEECLSKLSELNLRFHNLIFECANNQTLITIVEQVLSRLALKLYALGSPDHLRQFAESHQRMVLAISKHDADAAEKEAHFHINLMQEILSNN